MRSVAELVAAAKAKPGAISFATTGIGGNGHYGGELLQRALGIQLTHVPYKGTAPAMQDVVAGLVPVTVGTLVGTIGGFRNGQIRPLAVLSPQRAPELPDVPTLAELGHPMVDTGVWYGLLAPAGTAGAAGPPHGGRHGRPAAHARGAGPPGQPGLRRAGPRAGGIRHPHPGRSARLGGGRPRGGHEGRIGDTRPMRMQAAIMFEQGKPRPYATSNALVIEDVELEGPGPGEVLIEVAAAGLCHSDLSAIEGIRPRPLARASSGMRAPGSSANAARVSPT